MIPTTSASPSAFSAAGPVALELPAPDGETPEAADISLIDETERVPGGI